MSIFRSTVLGDDQNAPKVKWLERTSSVEISENSTSSTTLAAFAPAERYPLFLTGISTKSTAPSVATAASAAAPSPNPTIPAAPASSNAAAIHPGASSEPEPSSQARSAHTTGPSLLKKTKQKGHAFTLEQEEYIARLLSVPETWQLLDGPGEKNSHYRPKTEVRAEIALKVNDKFSTEGKELMLDGAQIKNKIESMKKVWKKANALFKKAGNGELPANTLEARSVQLTGNLTHSVLDMGDDSSEESDRQDTFVAVSDANEVQHGASIIIEQRMSPSPATQLKRQRNDFSAYTDVLQVMARPTREYHKVKQRRPELDERKDQWEDRLMQLQTEKLEFDMEIERKSNELRLQKINNQVQEEAKRASIAAKKAEMADMLLEVEMTRVRKQLQEANAVPQGTGPQKLAWTEFQKAQQTDEYEVNLSLHVKSASSPRKSPSPGSPIHYSYK
ncbi:hypothetical protein BGZ98_000803 [Dissophora globulifera]|nr:hypothetical protein BGZ98_000803 [Dissophora globulifera]